MDGRNIDSEFSRIVSVLAAEDVELADYFRARMFGPVSDAPDASDGRRMEGMIRTQYDLDARAYSMAVGRCVAHLSGIQLGSELF